MENWITYIAECALCLALLYLPFWGLLKKETFFQYNRYVLLAITALSFLLPLISIPEITSQLVPNETLSIQLDEINVMISGKALSEEMNWKAILTILYLSGAAICLLYKMNDLIRLIRFIPRGCIWEQTENGIHIHCHAHHVLPFSWMNHIVISEKDYEENGENILLHEQAHIACKHSWDVVWLSMPEFPGGMGECMKWLGKNIKYPTIAQENGVQGRVIVQFVVTKEGNIEEPVVANGVDPYLDAEALRVIKAMPKWKPGKQRGKEVNVKYTLPIHFRLQ